MDDDRAEGATAVHDASPQDEPAPEADDLEGDGALDRLVASFNDIDRARLGLDESAADDWLSDEADIESEFVDDEEPSHLQIAMTFVASLAVLALTIGAALILGLALGDRTPADANVAASQAAMVVGTTGAPLTIEVWADFQCPYCAEFNRSIAAGLVHELVLPGKARLVYRDFAFLGPESLTAATAARCAGAQGHYQRYHDLLFALQQGENQGRFSSSLLLQIGRFTGLDEAKLAACMNDAAVQQAVQDETARGRSLGVESTPTLRLIGPAGTITTPGLQTWTALVRAIDQVSGRVPMDSPAPTAQPGASQQPAVPSPAP